MVMPLTIETANLGMADSLILMVMALVVFGPRRLPQIGRQIGKLMYEFRKASNDFKFQMEEELRSVEEAERRLKDEERLRAMALAPASPAPAAFPVEAPAQVDGAQIPAGDAASPYPGEALYPVQPSAEAPAPPEETYPRIQPPATGEPVSANPPNSLAAQVKAPEQTAPEAIAPDPNQEATPVAEAPAKPKRKRTRTKPATETEPVNRNG